MQFHDVFKYTKNCEKNRNTQYKQTEKRGSEEWLNTRRGGASQSDFTAGCVYPHIHLHNRLSSTLQKKEDVPGFHCSIVPGNPVCMLLNGSARVCTAGAFVLWYYGLMQLFRASILFLLIFCTVCLRLNVKHRLE